MEKTLKTGHSIERKAALAAHLAVLTALAALTAGCGQQAFQASASIEAQQAPGTFVVPPKVDVLLVQDDTGGVMEAFSQLNSQMPTFLTDLTQRGWDYHFATVPLTTFRAINQVQASRYDGNWGSQWLAPFPGASLATLFGQVAAQAFRLPENYHDFLNGSRLSNSLEGREPGFLNLRQQLRHSSMTSTGFLRADSMLAVLVVGNGEDTSGVNICPRNGGNGNVACERAGDNYGIPCGAPGANPAPYCASAEQSFGTYRSFFQTFKANPQQIKMYAAVAQERSAGNCLGSHAFAGTRYSRMATDLGGTSFDLCEQPVNQILDSMADHLQGAKYSMRTEYLFIAQAPKDDEMFKVYRNPGGNTSAAVMIDRDPAHLNGWDYVGQVNDVFTIDSPAPMNRASGLAIRLYGTAKLMGNDTATVRYNPAGTGDTVSQ